MNEHAHMPEEDVDRVAHGNADRILRLTT